MLKISNIKKIIHSISNPIYILCTALFLIILLGVINSPSIAYAKTIDKMNIGQSADSYLYYMALTDCINNNKLSYGNGTAIIAESDANALNWFGIDSSDTNDGDINSPPAYGGAATQPSNQIIDTLHCRGKPSNLIEKALSAWGYTDGIEALCAFGLKRRTIIVNSGTTGSKPTGGEDVDCIAGSTGQDEFYTTESNQKFNLGTFQAAVKKKVYNGDGRTDISFTDPIAYHIFRQAFYTGCLDTNTVKNPELVPAPSTDGIEPSRDNNYYKIKDVDTAGIEKENIYKGKAKSEKVIFYTNPRGWTTMTCGELADKLNNGNLAKAYSDKLKENLKDTSIDKEGVGSGNDLSTGEKPTCGAQMKLLGWIICPIIEGLAGLNDMMFKLIESLLIVNPLTQDATDNTYIAWGSMRNLANAAFVIAFLIIIFSQMSGAGITNYGIKKLLPKLIVCAILVNLSYLIMQVLVDIANIAGSSIYSILKSLTPDISKLSWMALFNLSVAGTLGSAGLLIGATTVGAATMIWLLLPIIIMGALAFIAAFATLVFRQAAIPILAILSPLAFVAYLLPNTESWFKKWKDTFTSMLVLYPTAALLFGGCYFVSHSMIGDGSDWWKLMMGLVVMALPLFSLPFIAKQGGAILSKVNGALNGAADKFKKPVGNWSSKNAERVSEASKNRAMNSDKWSPRGTYLRRQSRLDAIKNSQAENFKRGEASYIAKAALDPKDNSFLNQLSKGGAVGAEERALAKATEVKAKITADEVNAQTALIKDFNKDQINELAMGGYVDVGGRRYDSKQSSSLRTAAMKRAVDTGDIATVNQLLDQSATTAMDDETRISLGDILMTSSGTPTYVGKSTAAQIKEGTGAGNTTQIIKKSLSTSKPLYSANKLADAADDELQAVLKVINDPTSGVTAAEKQIIRENAELAATDPTYQGRIAKQINEIEKLRII